jgi:CDP-diacylglycerol--glycerol-3-phosphate 3-phosphatidyltransferase
MYVRVGFSAGTLARGWVRERVVSVPNVITVTRTCLSMGLSVYAGYTASVPLLVAAYLVYWLGDFADGWSARRLDQETRLGAVFDIVCDRACAAVAAAAFLRIDPDSTPAIGIYLFQFCVVDTMLSLSFLAFDIKSPNYYYLVDRVIYRLNWTHPAKALNTSAVVVLCLANQVWAAAFMAFAVLAVKAWSLARLAALTEGGRVEAVPGTAPDSTIVS